MANELHERLYLAVTLFNYFEKQGYIGSFRNQDLEQRIELGNKNLEDSGLLTEVKDEDVNALLINYVGKVLIITSEFYEFVDNNYIFKEELRHQQNIKLSWAAIIVAIIIGIISIVISLRSNSNSEVEEFHNDYKNNYIEQKLLLNRLDSINNSLKKSIEVQKSSLDTNHYKVKK